MQKFEKHSPVVVTEVTTKHELRQFMQYPNRLYADNPNYIPSFYGDDLSDWTPGKNPAFDYCEARCWLAWRDGEIVGRIGAILSHKANDKFGTHRMRFSQVDFVDDSEVSAALFGTVERWAREKGCDQVHGPLGFTDMDREGMLVEGFDRRSLFFTNYNAPYYLEHLTRSATARTSTGSSTASRCPNRAARRPSACTGSRSLSSSASTCTWPPCITRASMARSSVRYLSWSTRPTRRSTALWSSRTSRSSATPTSLFRS